MCEKYTTVNLIKDAAWWREYRARRGEELRKYKRDRYHARKLKPVTTTGSVDEGVVTRMVKYERKPCPGLDCKGKNAECLIRETDEGKGWMCDSCWAKISNGKDY